MKPLALKHSDGATQPAVDRLVALDREAYALALRLVGSASDAEDIVQQAYLKAVSRLRNEPDPQDAGTWFMTVVANTAKDHLRTSGRRARKEAAVRTRESVVNQSADAELIGALRSAIENLEPDSRALVSLCCEHGYSQRQAARIMELPARTVSDRLRAALEQLRATLGAAGFTAAPAVIVGGLQHTAPVVPAGLATFVQSLTAAAGEGAVAVGKAAAGAALRISARFSAKKAAGLALWWKVGAVTTAAAVGGAALVAVNSGTFDVRVAVAPVEAARAAGMTSGLAGWWKFDEGTGDVAHDSSGNGNHGRISGAQWTEGRHGTGLLLDGAGQLVDEGQVEVPWTALLVADRGATIAAWVRLLDTPGTGDPSGFLRIGQKGDSANYRMSLFNAHILKLVHGCEPAGSRTATADVSDWPRGWFHVAFTVTADRGGAHSAYLNGRSTGPISYARWSTYPHYLMRFNRLVCHSEEPFQILSRNGLRCVVDEVRAYTRKLEAEEVARLAEEGEPPE